MISKIKNNLNPKQIEALKVTDKPLLILAGAGSGKTRIITYKIAYLINELSLPAYSILALTFTNKAAAEMKNRIFEILNKTDINTNNMWVSTFHSFCARILRREAEKIGYTNNFTIYDNDDSKKIIKEIIKKHRVNNLKTPSEVFYQISKRKNKPYPAKSDFINDVFDNTLYKVYTLYEDTLFNSNAIDFDNIILKTIELFKTNPDILNKYRGLFKYILVDEFQDTNEAQYELIKLLTNDGKNISIVGDDDQSIYAFRGAIVKNIINFTEDFEDCVIVRLEQNYRSTQNILNAANSVIKNNTERLGKELWSEKQKGAKVKIINAKDEREEGLAVVDIIKDIYKKNESIGIFYRVNSQSRIFEEKLKQAGILYQIFGTVKFYDRMEIKDILAYLNLIVNNNDDLNLKRIVNVPKRGIGKKTVEKISGISEDLMLPMYNSIIYAIDNGYFNETTTKKLKRFINLINDITDKKDKLEPVEFIKTLLNDIKYFDYIADDERSEDRIDNINEFINSIKDHIENNPEGNIETFLQQTALYTDIDSYNPEDCKVFLMTVHNAKGLEFDSVFITGMEENIFPHFKSMNSETEIEEERRLFYVAITRAKENLYISSAKMRKQYGTNFNNPASRFLKELNENLLDYHSIENELYFNSAKTNNFSKKYNWNKNKNIDEYKSTIKDTEINIGDILVHDKFGEGKVTFKKGKGDLTTIKLKFTNDNEKIFVLKYANLKKKECA